MMSLHESPHEQSKTERWQALRDAQPKAGGMITVNAVYVQAPKNRYRRPANGPVATPVCHSDAAPRWWFAAMTSRATDEQASHAAPVQVRCGSGNVGT